MVVIDNHLTSG